MLYDEQRYLYRGKVAKSRFEKGCLSEYAEIFKSVCVDAGYYRFPNEKYIAGLVSQVPDDFKFGFKVTDEITIRKFTRLPRHGDRGGKMNEHFLNADLFQQAFLAPCEPYKKNIGVLMFEFSRFLSRRVRTRSRIRRTTRRIPRRTTQKRRLAIRRRNPQPLLSRARLFRNAQPPRCHPRLQQLDPNARRRRAART